MRTTIVLTFAILAMSWPISIALAQEETEVDYIDYGGVLLPVPGNLPAAPRQIAPGQTDQESSEQPRSVRGSATGRTEIDPETGETRQVFQSSRISSVTQSHSRDRFSWFYDAIALYTGIIPNLRDSLPHIARHQQAGQVSDRPNQVTWIGFQPLPGTTRVFVQCSRAPQYQILQEQEGHSIEILLEHTNLSLSNFARFMDTSYFGRSVGMIDAEQLRGQCVRVVIWRDELAPFTVTEDGSYLYVDFQDVGRY